MYEPLLQRTREEVVVILQQGGERGAVRRAVRMQVMSALGSVEVTAVGVQQIAYDVMRGAFQAAEQAGKPIEIVGEEASAGMLEAVREKGGKATQYLREAIQGTTAAVEEYAAKLKDMASEVAEKSRHTLQSLIDRLKSSGQR
jgi:phosphate uptake regulator